jgi:hypothetical protein
MKSIISNTKGQLDINLAVTAILGLILASAFLVIGIVVLQGVVDGSDISASSSGTGTYTQSGNITLPEYNVTATLATVVIGSETFTFSNVSGAFAVNVAGGNNNTSQSLALLVTEINANSTLVTAVDNGDNTTTITSVLETSAGNYASTETVTNGVFAAAVMAGGAAADTMYSTLASVTDDIGSAMSLAGTLILVIIGVAILMLLAGVMVIMRVFR